MAEEKPSQEQERSWRPHAGTKMGASAGGFEVVSGSALRIVYAAVEHPIDAESAGDGDDVGIVADKDDEAVAWLAECAGYGLAGRALLDGPVDVVEEIGRIHSRDSGRAESKIPTRRVELHQFAHGSFIDASPAGIGIAHALGVFEEQILSQRRSSDERPTRGNWRIAGAGLEAGGNIENGRSLGVGRPR